jgi:hypothetical protein
LGTLMQAPVYYMHEDFAHLIKFPAFPLSFDFTRFALLQETFQRILEESSAEKGENILHKEVPEAFRFIFQINAQQRYQFNPVGELLQNLYRISLQNLRKPLQLHCSKNHPHLWGKGPLRIEQIPDPAVRLLIYRIMREEPLLEKAELLDIIDYQKADTAMLLKENTGKALVYFLKTSKGTELLRLKSTDSDKLLSYLGQKIYP